MAIRAVEVFGLDSPAAVRLLNESGYYLNARGQYAEAEPLYRHALTIFEKTLRPDHQETAASATWQRSIATKATTPRPSVSNELAADSELEVVSGGLNPQPLPPGRFTPSNQY